MEVYPGKVTIEQTLKINSQQKHAIRSNIVKVDSHMPESSSRYVSYLAHFPGASLKNKKKPP